ncbi:pancreatic secretory trypsin inhibitor-like [Pelobates cultripes]|uniref:Pancreatic secretory trypsin inhibitor-like n=1 Tax=Pelobates cultripes TaxID=61616 RepID=A0AAD1RS68_PELCU|nr:pancreatic secretory trypsin inhibitor-like [Pelobates cultripes]
MKAIYLTLLAAVLLSGCVHAGVREPKCPGHNICPLIFSPVCGTDGVMYPSECELCVKNKKLNAHVRIAHNGMC